MQREFIWFFRNSAGGCRHAFDGSCRRKKRRHTAALARRIAFRARLRRRSRAERSSSAVSMLRSLRCIVSVYVRLSGSILAKRHAARIVAGSERIFVAGIDGGQIYASRASLRRIIDSTNSQVLVMFSLAILACPLELGGFLLTVDCLGRGCSRARSFAISELANFYGRDSTVGQVLRRMRCSGACGGPVAAAWLDSECACQAAPGAAAGGRFKIRVKSGHKPGLAIAEPVSAKAHLPGRAPRYSISLKTHVSAVAAGGTIFGRVAQLPSDGHASDLPHRRRCSAKCLLRKGFSVA
jgi:hypothetical protein